MALAVSLAACGGTVYEGGTAASEGGAGGTGGAFQYPFGGTGFVGGGSGGTGDVRPALGGSFGVGGAIPLGVGGVALPPAYGGSVGLGGIRVQPGVGGWVSVAGAAGEPSRPAGSAGVAGAVAIAGWGGVVLLAGSAGVAGEGPVAGRGGLAGAGDTGTCDDGVLNGDEEDVDCGGRCPACVVPCTCNVPEDCESLVCIDCQCVAPACDDGVANGAETDVDCGGADCSPCPPGMTCLLGSDCTSLVCLGGICLAPTCEDAVQNQDETDVDCGGSVCLPCDDGQHCATHADCASGVCLISVCGGPPSCDGGLDCNGESCCMSIQVPGGTYPMGRGSETCADCVAGCPTTIACSFNEETEHPASVSPFALDKYEVTVGRFRAFVNAGAGPPSPGLGAHPLISGSGWDSAWDAVYPADQAAVVADLQSAADCSWTDTAGGSETYAINCVTWYEAFAFCAWDGGRLPTEAEWEYVAAGGDENRLYPWGAAEPTAAHANYGISGSSAVAVGGATLGTGRWGHLDLAGNVYEWTLDGYSVDYYSSVSSGCDDCANLGVTAERSIRGGGWTSSEFGMRAVHRDGWHADQPRALTGFRCARDP